MDDYRDPLIGFSARIWTHLFVFALCAYVTDQLFAAPPLLSVLVPAMLLAGLLYYYTPGISRLYALAFAVILFNAAMLLKSPHDYTVNGPLLVAAIAALLVSMFLKPSTRRRAA